jgi:hypothetical protein
MLHCESLERDISDGRSVWNAARESGIFEELIWPIFPSASLTCSPDTAILLNAAVPFNGVVLPDADMLPNAAVLPNTVAPAAASGRSSRLFNHELMLYTLAPLLAAVCCLLWVHSLSVFVLLTLTLTGHRASQSILLNGFVSQKVS